MFYRFIISSLIITLSLGFYTHEVFAESTQQEAQKAADYLLSQRAGDGSIGGVGFSGWALQALAAAGRSSGSTIQYLENNTSAIEAQAATDFERTILAVIAAGANPRSFGGKDLVALLRSRAQTGQIGLPGLLNDDTFGVLALLAAGEPVTDPLVISTATHLSSQQQSDGSFSWSRSGIGDSNNTAAAIEALQLAKQKGIVVTYNIGSAIEYLRRAQNNDGGFGYQPSQPSDGASTSWVIHAIIALGQQPESWQKDRKNPYDFLSSLQLDSGGVKWQVGSDAADILTTAYATIAFARRALPVVVTAAVPNPSPMPSITPVPTKEPSASPSAVPAPTPSLIASPLPSPSLAVSPIALPSPTNIVTPSPTPAARPTSSPTMTQFLAVATPQISPSPPPTSQPTTSPTPSSQSHPSPALLSNQSLPSPVLTQQTWTNIKISPLAQVVNKTRLVTTLPSPQRDNQIIAPTKEEHSSTEQTELITLPLANSEQTLTPRLLTAALMVFSGFALVLWGVAATIQHRLLERVKLEPSSKLRTKN